MHWRGRGEEKGPPGGCFAWVLGDVGLCGLWPPVEPGTEFCEHILGPIHLPRLRPVGGDIQLRVLIPGEPRSQNSGKDGALRIQKQSRANRDPPAL